MTPRRRFKRVTDRLRAIAGRPVNDDDDTPRSRVHVASFEHTHRVWVAPDPPRRWFEKQDIEELPAELRLPLKNRRDRWW